MDYATSMWFFLAFLLLNSKICQSYQPPEVHETITWSRSDLYVSKFASILEIAIASRGGQESGTFFLRDQLGKDIRLVVEREKILFSQRLRNSFSQFHSGEYDGIKPDPSLLPYFVDEDIAPTLVEEGFKVPLSKKWGIKNSLSKESDDTVEQNSRRELFDFPIRCSGCSGCTWSGCSGCSGCETDFKCWGISKALNGLTMDETCDLLETFQTLGGDDLAIEDILRELPIIIETLGKIESIFGTVTLPHCTELTEVLNTYSANEGQELEKVFYYPKALCERLKITDGCLMESLYTIKGVLSKPIVSVIPQSTEESLKTIFHLIADIKKQLPTLCTEFSTIGLFESDSVKSFSDKWTSLFSPVPLSVGEQKTKMEVILDIVETIESVEFARAYLPAIPHGCKPVLANAAIEVYSDVIGNNVKPEEIPTTLCRVLGSNAVSSCMTDFSNNIDQVEWMKETIGIGVMSSVVSEIVPSICSSIDEANGLSVDGILDTLPTVISLYKKLDSNFTIGLLGPHIHDVLIECNNPFSELVTDISKTMRSGKEKDYLDLICTSVAGNTCLNKLSDSLDTFSFITDHIGKGTLRYLVSRSLPDACALTSEIFDHLGKFNVEKLLSHIPEVIFWYKNLAGIPQLSKFIPKWPDEQCSIETLQKLRNTFHLDEHSDQQKLPQKICNGFDESIKLCVEGIGKSFEDSSFLRETFSSKLANVGPEMVFKNLARSLIPGLCQSIDDVSGELNTAQLIRSIPLLLDSYRQLGVVGLQDIYPRLNSVLLSTCNDQLSQLSQKIASSLESDDVTHSMMSVMCKHISNNDCLVKLSEGLDEVTFITNQIGKGALSILVTDTIPSACSIISTEVGTFDPQNLLYRLDKVFDMLLRLRTVEELRDFIPPPPGKECQNKIQMIVDTVTTQNENVDIPSLLCNKWTSDGSLECVSELGDNLMGTEFIREVMYGSNHEGTNLFQSLVDRDIPFACNLLRSVSDENISSSGLVIESIPSIFDHYTKLYQQLPAFAKELLPKFPESRCSNNILVDISKSFEKLLLTPNSQKFGFICSESNQGSSNIGFLTASSKDCLIAIGESIEQNHFISDKLGLSAGFFDTLVNEDLKSACSIALDTKGGISVENLLGKFPAIISFISSMRDKIPKSFQNYIPIMPSGCDDQYTIIGETLGHIPIEQVPSKICKLEHNTLECIAQLGDAVDEVEMIRNMIGGKGLIRDTIEILEDTACDIMEEINDLETLDFSEMPMLISQGLTAIDRLGSYEIFDSILPGIPKQCPGQLKNSSTALKEANKATTYIDVVCSLSTEAQTCISDLGTNLEAVQWVSNQVSEVKLITENFLNLAPSICSYISGQVDIDEVLLKLPVAFSIINHLQKDEIGKGYIPKMSDQCILKFDDMSENIAVAGTSNIPNVLCSLDDSTKRCLIETSQTINSIPENLVKDIIYGPLPKACDIFDQLGSSINYNEILPSLPKLIDLLVELDKIQLIRPYIPDLDDKCVQVLGNDLSARLPNEADSSIPEMICSLTEREKKCMISLADEALSIQPVSELVQSALGPTDYGPIALVEETFGLLPRACTLLSGVLSNKVISSEDVLGTFPELFSFLEKLGSYSIFRPYVPELDSTCDKEVQDFLHENINETNSNTGMSSISHSMCMAASSEQIADCFVSVAKEFDKLDFYQKSLKNLGDDATIEAMVEVAFAIAPKICNLMYNVFDGTEINFDKVFENIPIAISIYNDAQKELNLDESFLPRFPSEYCPSTTLDQIFNHLEKVIDNSDEVVNVLCRDFSKPEKLCISAIADVLGKTVYLQDAFGRSGLIEEIFGEPLESFCALIDTDLSEMKTEVAVSNILENLDLLLELISSIRGTAPDFLGNYLPVISQSCVWKLGEFGRITKGIFGESKSSLVADMCKLPSSNFDCLADFGDSLEHTQIFSDILWNYTTPKKTGLLREISTILNTTVCSFFDDIGDISLEITSVIGHTPTFFHLLDTMSKYPYLQDYIPEIPGGCSSSFVELSNKLESINVDEEEMLDWQQSQLLCSIGEQEGTKSCLVTLGENLEKMSVIKVPGAGSIIRSGLDLLKPICSTLIGCNPESKCAMNSGNILQYLPDFMSLLGKIDSAVAANGIYTGLSSQCKVDLVELSSSIVLVDTSKGAQNKKVTLNLEKLFCTLGFSDGICMKQLGSSLESLPVLSDFIPKGLIAFFVDVCLKGDACKLLQSIENMNYEGFVVALPLLMQTLDQLEDVSFLQGYIPKISSQCKTTFSTTIAEKITNSIAKNSHLITQGETKSLQSGLDLSPLSDLLCGYTNNEIDCFKEAGKATVEAPEINALILESIKKTESDWKSSSLDKLVNAGLDIREDMCSVFDHIAHFNFENIIDIAPEILRLMGNLNVFPMVSEYIPDIEPFCIDSLIKLTTTVTDIKDICPLDFNATWCLNDLAKNLDQISEISSIYKLLSGNPESTIEGVVRNITVSVLPSTCTLIETIRSSISGLQISNVIVLFPDIVSKLRILKSYPFVGSFVPKMTSSCEDTLIQFGLRVKAKKTELLDYDSSQEATFSSICDASEREKECLIELDESLHQCSLIKESVPTGIIKPFIQLMSEKQNCKTLKGANTHNITNFLVQNFPSILQAANNLVDVDKDCKDEITKRFSVEADSISKGFHFKTICTIEENCREKYVKKLSKLPLIGKYVPPEIEITVTDFCKVNAGLQSISEFLSKHLETFFFMASQLTSINQQCSRDFRELSQRMKESSLTANYVCTFLVSDNCLNSFLSSWEQLPFDNTVIPRGVSILVEESCEYLSESGEDGRTVFSLLPHLPVFVEVLGLSLGFPSDECAREFVSAGEAMLKLATVENNSHADFDISVFCSHVQYKCMHEFVSGLGKLPFVGDYIPSGTDELIAETCAVIHNRDDFGILETHLPVMFDLIQKLLYDLQLRNTCRDKVTTLMFDRYGNFKPEYVCAVSPECSNALIKNLKNIPVLGAFVPDVTTRLFEDLCSLIRRIKTDDKMVQSDMPRLLPEIIGTLGELTKSKDPECGNQFIQFYENSNGLLEEEQFCSYVSDEACRNLLAAKLERTPLIGKFVPKRAGELLATSCLAIDNKDDERTLIFNILPSMFFIAGDMIPSLDSECREAFTELGALYKISKYADAEEFCNHVSVDCARTMNEKVTLIPFIGSHLPQSFEDLLRYTCKSIDHPVQNFYDVTSGLLQQSSTLSLNVSENCSPKLKKFSKVHRQDKFDVASFCDQLGKGCVEDFAKSLPNLPFMGPKIPADLFAIYKNACKLTKKAGSNEKVFFEVVLPQVLISASDISALQKSEQRALQTESACTHQVESFSTKSYEAGKVNVNELCKLDKPCLELLVDSLYAIPLIGEAIPETSSEIIYSSCSSLDRRLDNSYKDKFIFQFKTAIQLVKGRNQDSSKCFVQSSNLLDVLNSTVKVDNPVDPISLVCSNLDSECLASTIESYRSLPMFCDAIEKSYDIILKDICSLRSGTYSSKQAATEVTRSGGILDQSVFIFDVQTVANAECESFLQSFKSEMEYANSEGLPMDSGLSCKIPVNCIEPTVSAVFNSELLGPELRHFFNDTKALTDELESMSSNCADDNPETSAFVEFFKDMDMHDISILVATIMFALIIIVAIIHTVIAPWIRRKTKKRDCEIDQNVAQRIVVPHLDATYT